MIRGTSKKYEEMNIFLRPNDYIFRHIDNFLCNPCFPTFVYINNLSDPSLIKLNYFKFSLSYVHACLCMLCTHAYTKHRRFGILMWHRIIKNHHACVYQYSIVYFKIPSSDLVFLSTHFLSTLHIAHHT